MHPQGAKRLHPKERQIELTDGTSVSYDYLVIATGPDLAFDEIEGFGPAAHTQSICHIDHALRAKLAVDALIANPGPVVLRLKLQVQHSQPRPATTSINLVNVDQKRERAMLKSFL